MGLDSAIPLMTTRKDVPGRRATTCGRSPRAFDSIGAGDCVGECRERPHENKSGVASSSLPNQYAVLGITRTADLAAIQAAYKRLALVTHPDKGGSASVFCAVSEAFDTLSSPFKRQSYDLLLGNVDEASGNSCGSSGRNKRPRSVTSTHEVGPASRREKALTKLKDAISDLAKDQKGTAITNLPSHVAKALFMWMKEHGVGLVASTPSPLDRDIASGGSVSDPVVSDIVGVREDDGMSEESGIDCADSALLEVSRSECTSSMSAPAEHSGIKRVGGGSQLYTAYVSCLNLVMQSRATSFETASRFHTALVLLKHGLEQKRTALEALDIPDLAQHITMSTWSACKASGVTVEELCISLTPCISARWEIGTKICGRRTQDVRLAVAQRAQLINAKEAGWPKLREVWIGILAASRGEAKATAIVDAAWSRHAPRRAAVKGRGRPSEMAEARRKCKLLQAVQEVEKALDVEGREADAAERARDKAQRVADREHARAVREQERERVLRRRRDLLC
mmetsp:Transcript_40286/g.107368  ORF Transcript_40286/g.107368 Transcript_40286/m.107368 type:complete len:511 (-) Transcript_40286:231-1763(-)